MNEQRADEELENLEENRKKKKLVTMWTPCGHDRGSSGSHNKAAHAETLHTLFLLHSRAALSLNAALLRQRNTSSDVDVNRVSPSAAELFDILHARVSNVLFFSPQCFLIC